MAVLKKIKFGDSDSTNNIQFTEVKPASGGVITATGANTDLDNVNNPEYVIDLTIANDGTLAKENGALKVDTVPAAQVSVAAGGHDASAEEPDSKTFVGDDVEEVLLELNQKIEQTGNAARTYTLVDDTENVLDLPSNVAKRYRLQETIGTQNPTLVGANIDIPKDSSLKEVYLGSENDTINTKTGVITKQEVTDPQSMNFAYQLADGTYSLVKIDVSKFLTESEFGDGLAVSGEGVVSVKVDSTSESFLSVGANGVKVSGVQDAINSAIDALDVDDTAETGKYVSSVDETNGKVLTTKANVSDAVLNGYTKGTVGTAVAATNTINEAFSKIEVRIDNNEQVTSAALNNINTKINGMDKVADAVPGQVVTTVSEADGVVNETKANVKDLQLGGYAKDTSANRPIEGTDTINTALSKLENAIDAAKAAATTKVEAEETRAKAAETAIDGAVGLTKDASGEGRTYTNTGEYIGKETSNTVASDIKALDTQLKAVTDKVNAIQYKVTGTTLEFFEISEKTGA